GIERDGQDRRHQHREVLGESQRPEEAPFLRLQREDRQERDRDDEQRKETRPADFLYGVHDDGPVINRPAGAFPFFKFLVRLLDHHNGGVHHGADGDGDAAERHDVGGHPQRLHGNERNNDRDGNRQDRDNGARDVPEKDQDHQGHDGQLFRQRTLQIVDRAQNQLRAVVGGNNLNAR